MEMVAALVKLPVQTLRDWKQQPWWSDFESQIRDEENIKSDKKLSSIVDRTMDLLSDRVEHGDFVWDSKNQALVRRPLLARDAVRVAGDLFDRREFLRKARREKEINVQNVEQTLLRVAEQFIKIAKARREPIDITEYTEVTTNEGSDQAENRRTDVQGYLPSSVGGESGGSGLDPDVDQSLPEPVSGRNEDDAVARGDSRPSGSDGLGGEGADGLEDGEALFLPDPRQP